MFCPRCHRSYDDPGPTFCPEDGMPLTTERRIAHIRARPTQQVGAILDGRYELKGLIGKGGMARVYLAEDTRTKEPVAVKILNHDVSRDGARAVPSAALVGLIGS